MPQAERSASYLGYRGYQAERTGVLKVAATRAAGLPRLLFELVVTAVALHRGVSVTAAAARKPRKSWHSGGGNHGNLGSLSLQAHGYARAVASRLSAGHASEAQRTGIERVGWIPVLRQHAIG